MSKKRNFGEIVILERECLLNDYPFVFGLIKETIFPLVRAYIEPDENIFKERYKTDFNERIILSVNGKDIGFYQIGVKSEVLTIKGIFLEKSFRGKGIGKFYMQEFENMGAERIQLQVWDNNPSLGFYQKLGYKIIKEENHKYLMEKVL